MAPCAARRDAKGAVEQMCGSETRTTAGQETGGTEERHFSARIPLGAEFLREQRKKSKHKSVYG
jgi:hypothetical protein